MTPEAFHQLLDMITPLIQKQDTMMREAISPYETVALTLRYQIRSDIGLLRVDKRNSTIDSKRYTIMLSKCQ